MELKREIAARIAGDRRRLFMRRSLVAAAIAALVAALSVLIVIPYFAGAVTFTPLVRETGMGLSVWVSLALGLVLAAILALAFLPGYARARRGFFRMTSRATGYDITTLARYLNVLEGVAQDAGTGAPRLEVLSGEAPNALAFQGSEEPAIGITAKTLASDLAFDEVRAVLAHELACVLSGDCLRRPGAPRFESFAYAALGLAGFLCLFSVAVVRQGNASWVTFLVAATGAAAIGAIALLLRWHSRASAHDAAGADEIALMITGDPAALSSAITRMDRLVNGRRRMPFPESDYGLDYLFARPHRWTETPEAWIARRSKELDYDLAGKRAGMRIEAIRESMDELAAAAIEGRDERLEALRNRT